MNNRGQIEIGGMEINPVGILGALVGGFAAYYIQSTANLGFLWNIMALLIGCIAGYFVTGKILGGGQ